MNLNPQPNPGHDSVKCGGIGCENVAVVAVILRSMVGQVVFTSCREHIGSSVLFLKEARAKILESSYEDRPWRPGG